MTSFQPWRAHQPSNSSDDLLRELHRQNRLPADAIWIRQVPVSFELAPVRVISAIHQHRPDSIICCGMAENRPFLSIEQWAKGPGQPLQTSVELSALLTGTWLSEISNDAGTYVCNHLYYSVLNFISHAGLDIPALFIHVPVLSCANQTLILNDFEHVVFKMAKLSIHPL
ncbi:MAG: peptidase C15 [Phormidesmis sp.]